MTLWARRAQWWGRAWPWAAGAIAAVAVIGPGLAPGNLFLLDADFVAHYPVPAGVWALGPEIPRRVPLGLILAWASGPIGGAFAAKLVLAALLALAFAGACRLATAAAWPARLGAGAVYALSPLALTRLGAGQWNVVAAYAVAPWAIRALVAPGRRPASTLLWAAAMGATGSVGGTLAGVAVVVGLVAERSRAALWGTVLAAVAQLPWLVPGLVVVSGGGLHLAGSSSFPTSAPGAAGALGLLAGHGFWRPASQVGGAASPGTLILGAVLGTLAVLGASSLPRPWRWRMLVLAAIGMALALASALPLTSGAYRALTATSLGEPFREGQRNVILTLVWLAPASAWGAMRVAGRQRSVVAGATRAVPAVVALTLAVPGLWGVGGRLAPVNIPDTWGQARHAVQRRPGPVLALPFHLHLPLPLAGGHEVLNPLPDELGGDVISSPTFDDGSATNESADPRVARLVPVLARARGAEPVAGALARAGVRWVALLHAADWRAYGGLAADPGLVQVADGPTLSLFEVRAWAGPVTDGAGRTLDSRAVVAPWRSLASSGPAVVDAPAAPGWLRGSHGTGQTVGGLIRVPAGSGPVWYWPALLALGADALTIGAMVVAWGSLRRR